jgi:ComEC/Rec2-related protein
MRTHRPCLMLAIFLSAGICAGKYAPVSLIVWLVLSSGVLLLACISRREFLFYCAVFLCGATLFLGTMRLNPDHIVFTTYQQRQSIILFEGVAVTPPNKNIFDLQLRRVFINHTWQKRSGVIQVHLFKPIVIKYGDVVRLSGNLHLAFDGNDKFSYRRYLQTKGIFWILSVPKKGSAQIIGQKPNPVMALSLTIKNYAKSMLDRYLESSSAGVMTAMVLGDRSGMPKDIKEDFVKSGTAHILAISGMNMSIIAALVFFFFKLCRLSRKWQFFSTIIFLFCYAFLTGWSASIVRSCFMASVLLGSFALEEEVEPLNSFGFAVLVLLLSDPNNLFDIGFQLSFGAVLAILIFYERINTALQKFCPEFLSKTLAVSIAAWIGTAPTLFYWFKTTTPISLLANIPIVPLADLIVVLGLGLVVSGFIPFCAVCFAGSIKVVFAVMVILAHWFAQVPGGHLTF